ncbi:MAG: endonuclease/exonuclease/phosphatase family protein [Candidatus Cloacimonetes bacterium]|nr:endonuclease/exonuclease/phosphatase family protein [Candidatus Cloacimonadota bacterium]
MLKILTCNIANYDDHPGWERRKQKLTELLRQEQADLVMLQEVRFHPQQKSCAASYLNSGEELLAELHKDDFYQKHQIFTHPSMHYRDIENGIFWEGKTMLTSLKVLEAGSVFLPESEGNVDRNKRTLMWLHLLHNGKEIGCCNLHWSTDLQNHDLQAIALAKLADRFWAMPFITGGDFNSSPDTRAMMILREAGLTDIWHIKHPDRNGYTFPADLPKKRIDQFWGNRNFLQKVQSIHIPDSAGCSDHLALVLEAEL